MSEKKRDGHEGKGDDKDDARAAEAEARDIERYGIDERTLTPIGLQLPRMGFVPEAVVNVARFVWLGAWIALFVAGPTWLALVVMFGWIAANGAYEKHRKQLRRQRKREIEQVRRQREQLGSTSSAPALAASSVPEALTSPGSAASVTLPTADDTAGAGASPGAPSAAERALLRIVRRVERSDRFERRDVVLVTEISDVLFPLLPKVAAPGADPRVRRDVETLATEHLPDSVEAFLALPADYAREHRNAAGRTPREELRAQLDLLLTGCEQLRDAVLEADVARQQTQSRFLEMKFRPGELDL